MCTQYSGLCPQSACDDVIIMSYIANQLKKKTITITHLGGQCVIGISFKGME